MIHVGVDAGKNRQQKRESQVGRFVRGHEVAPDVFGRMLMQSLPSGGSNENFVQGKKQGTC
jgi:hypothetical protein